VIDSTILTVEKLIDFSKLKFLIQGYELTEPVPFYEIKGFSEII